MVKHGRWTTAILICSVAGALNGYGQPVPDKPLQPLPPYEQTTRLFARMLPATHLLQLPLDDRVAARALTNYLSVLDYEHAYFLQSDIDAFRQRQSELDDRLLAGDIAFAYEVFTLFLRRMDERVAAVERLLAQPMDFTVDESYRWKRKDAPWPATPAEQDELWRQRIKNEYLGIIIAREVGGTNSNLLATASVATNAPARSTGTNELPIAAAAVTNAPPPPTPEEFIGKRYRQFAIVMHDSDAEWVQQRYLTAFTAAYDPHSAFMAPAAVEDFNIDMNLSLSGIGAMLTPEDGTAKIQEVVPGGPAARDTRDIRLRPGDKIIGVGQDAAPIEDVLHLPLSQIVRKIRGRTGTRVVLNVISASDPSGSSTRLVDLIREEVKLEEQAATGRVARVTLPSGATRSLGIVRLPAFYGSMTSNPRDPSYRSCAADVARLVTQMNDEIDGLVLDLRNNGGGSLREAVDLTGRFIRMGPVVQVREIGRINVLPDRDPAVTFRKPMVVLVNRLSASASEIVAAALQDYGRAVVIGDSKTHGKGSVQTILPLGGDARQGSVKLTIANYYRVSGGSTQLRGVIPDLVLSSSFDFLELGEDKLPNAMPWTSVQGATYTPVADLTLWLPQLATNSAARLAKQAGYARHRRLVEHVRETSEQQTISLERGRRRELALAEREIRRVAEQDEGEETELPRAEDDVVLDEALQVLSDLVDLQKDGAMADEAAAPVDTQEWLRRIFAP